MNINLEAIEAYRRAGAAAAVGAGCVANWVPRPCASAVPRHTHSSCSAWGLPSGKRGFGLPLEDCMPDPPTCRAKEAEYGDRVKELEAATAERDAVSRGPGRSLGPMHSGAAVGGGGSTASRGQGAGGASAAVAVAGAS